MIVSISPRIEASVRELSIRIYLDQIDSEGITRKSDDYDAACSIFIYGDKGFLYNVHGKGFYLAFGNLIKSIREYGIRTLEGYVLKPHARLIKKEMARLGLSVTESTASDVFDRDMVWITIYI